MNASPVIAVTGLHRGENPQPGSAVIRSLRRVYPELRIIGLVYDSLESGLFSEEDAPDAAFTMSYPGAGEEAFWQRLDAIRAIERFDVLIPCLDAGMGPLVDAPEKLIERGIRVCLPSVSYTHLDVYKRQSHTRGSPRRACCPSNPDHRKQAESAQAGLCRTRIQHR